jgi:hypothetical protein
MADPSTDAVARALRGVLEIDEDKSVQRVAEAACRDVRHGLRTGKLPGGGPMPKKADGTPRGLESGTLADGVHYERGSYGEGTINTPADRERAIETVWGDVDPFPQAGIADGHTQEALMSIATEVADEVARLITLIGTRKES